MKFKQLIAVSILISTFSIGNQSFGQDKPKLVVGIVIDQMRYEYLHRFSSKYGEEGFNRLLNEGFSLRNGHYNYIPTYTGPGHASVYTGSTPALHGIISNEWYDKKEKQDVYCAEDSSVKVIGAEAGMGVSPHRLLTTTISDEMRMATQFKSKTIAISAKDRGAALPGGHTANAAYWYDRTSGHFISSSFYMDELPGWVKKFNKKGLADQFVNSTWSTLLPIEQYVESGPDNSPFETKVPTKNTAEFPYNLKAIKEATNRGYSYLLSTPFGNTLVTQMAIEALKNENLGKGEYTDMLTVSYSSTDYVGHAFGPNSVELEDTYLRMDNEIAELLNSLDNELGKGNYTVFLTADHGVSDIPKELLSNKLPGGLLDYKDLIKNLTTHLNKAFGEAEWIESVSNMQVFLNYETIGSKDIDVNALKESIVKFLIDHDGIATCYTNTLMLNGNYSESGPKGALIRGYNQKRSGDILFTLSSGWLENYGSVASHGSAYSYDTHVPIVFFGWGIKQGSSVQYHTITDIAPTISTLLNVKFPSGCTGQPIAELFGN